MASTNTGGTATCAGHWKGVGDVWGNSLRFSLQPIHSVNPYVFVMFFCTSRRLFIRTSWYLVWIARSHNEFDQNLPTCCINSDTSLDWNYSEIDYNFRVGIAHGPTPCVKSKMSTFKNCIHCCPKQCWDPN